MHLGERNREFRFHRTRSLFDLTIVDWKLYYTVNEHGFKFYPIISNFRLLFVRDNAFILHSKLNDIYFLVNFEFTSSIFLFPMFLSKLRFLENFPLIVVKYNFQESNTFFFETYCWSRKEGKKIDLPPFIFSSMRLGKVSSSNPHWTGRIGTPDARFSIYFSLPNRETDEAAGMHPTAYI